MAVEFGQFKLGQRKKREAESLAAALERESGKESGLQSMLGLAVPLLASIALPVIGGAIAPGLSSLLGGGALAKIATGTAGKMIGGTLGTKLLGEGAEGLSRMAGYGGDAKSISQSAGLFGRDLARSYASELSQMQGDKSDEWLSSVLSGVTMGGGVDALKGLFGGSKNVNVLNNFDSNIGVKSPNLLDNFNSNKSLANNMFGIKSPNLLKRRY
jgi:hypothetical protein